MTNSKHTPGPSWLNSRTDRYTYCDEAVEDYGQPKDTVTLLQYGQQREKEEVLGQVRAFLEERLEILREESESDLDSE